MYNASSAVARGMMPGSVKLVFNSVDITKTKSNTVTIKINGLTSRVKSGQLRYKFNEKNGSVVSHFTVVKALEYLHINDEQQRGTDD